MSTDAQTPDLGADLPAGVVLGAEQSSFGQQTGAAEHIRLLHDRFPAMSNTAIANKVGCDESNVRRVLQRYVRNCSLEELQDFQASKGDIYDAIQSKALSCITEDKLVHSSAVQLVTVAAILEDKSRLVRGQPTSIHVHALVDVLEALRVREASE